VRVFTSPEYSGEVYILMRASSTITGGHNVWVNQILSCRQQPKAPIERAGGCRITSAKRVHY